MSSMAGGRWAQTREMGESVLYKPSFFIKRRVYETLVSYKLSLQNSIFIENQVYETKFTKPRVDW